MSDNILTLKFPHRSFFATPQKGIARGATFDPVKLVNLAKTVSARISARVKYKHTPSPSELFVLMCYMYFKVKFGEGLVRLNVNGIVRQQCMICRASVNRKARPAMAKLARVILAKA